MIMNVICAKKTFIGKRLLTIFGQEQEWSSYKILYFLPFLSFNCFRVFLVKELTKHRLTKIEICTNFPRNNSKVDLPTFIKNLFFLA